jgi:hypothetical protein
MCDVREVSDVIDHRIKEKEKERGREKERENATVHYITLRTWTCVTHILTHRYKSTKKHTQDRQTDRQTGTERGIGQIQRKYKTPTNPTYCTALAHIRQVSSTW